MQTASIADLLRQDLESRGEYVVMANADTGWFAVFLGTWRHRIEEARRRGREGPNLVVYRTHSDDPRDHFVVPYSVVRDLLVEGTMTASKVNGSQRWNLTLKSGKLHVSHRVGAVDVSEYHGLHLLVEDAATVDYRDLAATDLEGFEEGGVQFRLHRLKERKSRAVRRKKEIVLERTGALLCESCDFDFEHVYGLLGKNFAECHHRTPLSRLTERHKTRLSELAIVCSNCHRMIHRSKPMLTVEQLRIIVLERRQPEFMSNEAMQRTRCAGP